MLDIWWYMWLVFGSCRALFQRTDISKWWPLTGSLAQLNASWAKHDHLKKNGLKHAKKPQFMWVSLKTGPLWLGWGNKVLESVRLKHQGSQNLQLICEQIPWISRRFCNQHNSDVWSNSRIYRCESRVDDVRIYSNPTKAWLSVTEIRHDSIAHHGDSTNTRPYLAVQLGWVHWNCTKQTIEDCWFIKN